MDFALTPAQEDLRRRTARWVDDTLIPLELEVELAGGVTSDAAVAEIRRTQRELGLVGGNHTRANGGLEWSMMEHVVNQEELGRNTNGVWWNGLGAYNVLSLGAPEQVERYLHPTLAGDRSDAYAVTERDAGSDAAGIAGTAERTASGYRLRAEKWFVTNGRRADYFIVVVNVVDGDRRLPTLFLVDRSVPGIEVLEDPQFTHHYPDGHPTISFDCEVPADAVLGGPDGVGRGNEQQNAWFVEERIHIAARCVGAMRRLLEETTAWATQREQFGQPIMDFQGVSFGLADSAAECVAARLMTYQCAQMFDDGAPPKLVHARAAMAKLYASEAANRCADRCLQVFGGRGYMRTNTAERYWRELRVDRIWEGTSEIQRLIVANGLVKRGVERVLAVDTAPGALQGP